MRVFAQTSITLALLGSVWGMEAIAQSGPIPRPFAQSHPEIIATMTCSNPNRDTLTRMFSGGQNRFGVNGLDWTKQDIQQMRDKYSECVQEAGKPGIDGNLSDLLQQLSRKAPDPEGDARRAAERQRADAAAQEQAKMEAAAKQAEDQRRAAEQQQLAATRTAQARAAEIEAQAQDLRDQQAAADQAARGRKQMAAAQAAAEQATAERIAKAKRDQLAAETAAEEAAQKMPKPITVDCAQASLLAQVQAVLAKRTNMEVFKIYSSEPNPTFTTYLAAPALERVRTSRQIFSVPQCYAMAMTSSGEMPLAFRVFKADGESYIEVTERQE